MAITVQNTKPVGRSIDMFSNGVISSSNRTVGYIGLVMTTRLHGVPFL
jgi:hypothetical protein